MAVTMCVLVCVCTGPCREQGEGNDGTGNKAEMGGETKRSEGQGRSEERGWTRGHHNREEQAEGTGTFSRISRARWHSGSASLYLPLLP